MKSSLSRSSSGLDNVCLARLSAGMDQRQYMMLSGVGLGLGLGLGIALLAKGARTTALSASMAKAQSLELTEIELMKQVVDGKESNVTFDEFPYYLNDQTRALLTNAAYVHLKGGQYSKFTRNLSPSSKAILLSGPPGTEGYQQMLAKALAHHFEAKLLLLDTDLVFKVQGNKGTKGHVESFPSSLHSAIANCVVDLCEPLTTGLLAVKEVLQTGGLRSSTTSPSERKTSTSENVDGAPALKAPEEIGSQGSPGRTAAPRNERLFVEALFLILDTLAQTSPVVLYLRDVERLLFRGPKTYMLFLRKLKKLSGPIVVLGSRFLNGAGTQEGAAEKLSVLFPYTINIKPPEDNVRLISWKSQLEEDMKAIQAEDNRNHISEVLSANDVECDDLSAICFSDTFLIGKHIEEVVISAISHHLMNSEEPEYRAGRLIISSKSLAYGLSLFQAGQLDQKCTKLQLEAKSGGPNKDPQETTAVGKSEVKEVPTTVDTVEVTKPEPTKADAPKKVEPEATKPSSSSSSAKPTVGSRNSSKRRQNDVPPDNEFEKRIRPEVVPAGEVGVRFSDIGALDNVKEALQELVMLPLRRPELFNRGGLVKRCKGILLFGPPGTGKTMLARAVATEAGASFINVSMSAITSKWFGEDEKNVRALFTLAAKVSPTVIFVDEVDSMLGQRSRVGEHEAMRKIKNEFMAHWDGLLTKGGDRVLVLAATNRPFDLDEAIIRRFERRIMVGLPDAENREKILRAILAKEEIAKDFDFKELALLTDGYTGSDLKNLCVAAAYRPVRELLKQEREQELKREAEKQAAGEAAAGEAAAGEAAIATSEIEASEDSTAAASETAGAEIEKIDSTEKGAAGLKPQMDTSSCNVISLRPLNIEDFKQAKTQVSPSFAAEGAGMQELQEWNELYGEGGSRKKQQLSYFL